MNDSEKTLGPYDLYKARIAAYNIAANLHKKRKGRAFRITQQEVEMDLIAALPLTLGGGQLVSPIEYCNPVDFYTQLNAQRQGEQTQSHDTPRT